MYTWAILNRLFETGGIAPRMILFFGKTWADARVYDAAAALLAADNASSNAKIAATAACRARRTRGEKS